MPRIAPLRPEATTILLWLQQIAPDMTWTVRPDPDAAGSYRIIARWRGGDCEMTLIPGKQETLPEVLIGLAGYVRRALT